MESSTFYAFLTDKLIRHFINNSLASLLIKSQIFCCEFLKFLIKIVFFVLVNHSNTFVSPLNNYFAFLYSKAFIVRESILFNGYNLLDSFVDGYNSWKFATTASGSTTTASAKWTRGDCIWWEFATKRLYSSFWRSACCASAANLRCHRNIQFVAELAIGNRSKLDPALRSSC